MAFVAGRQTIVLVSQYDLSAFMNDSTFEASVDNPTTPTYGSTSQRRTLVGLKDGNASFEGYWSGTAGEARAVLEAALGASSALVVSVGNPDSVLGSLARLISGREASYSVTTPVDGPVPISAQIEADGGVDFGVWLHELSAETATGNESSVDNGASSANGGVGHIHCLSVSASDTLDSVIAHSTDNSTFAPLITFTQLSAAGSERKEVTGTVNRYVREEHTLGGAAISINYAVSFARRV
mgnify:CR=1 FL=1